MFALQLQLGKMGRENYGSLITATRGLDTQSVNFSRGLKIA
jgi:hypothetical protein